MKNTYPACVICHKEERRPRRLTCSRECHDDYFYYQERWDKFDLFAIDHNATPRGWVLVKAVRFLSDVAMAGFGLFAFYCFYLAMWALSF